MKTKIKFVDEPISVKVRCDGSIHTIVLSTNGQLAFPNHKSIKDVERDSLMSAFGGKECRCTAILNAWREVWKANSYSYRNIIKKLPEPLADIVKDNKQPISRLWRNIVGRTTLSKIPELVRLTGTTTADMGRELLDIIAKTLLDRGHTISFDVKKQCISSIDNTSANVYWYAYSKDVSLHAYLPGRHSIGLTIKLTKPLFRLNSFINNIERSQLETKLANSSVFNERSSEAKRLKANYEKLGNSNSLSLAIDSRGIRLAFNASTRDVAEASALMKRLHEIDKYYRNTQQKRK